jgi:hypothetical protein
MIKQVVVYQTKGRQFPTLEAAQDHRENLIEEFIRSLPGFDTMRARDRITFVQSIIDRRKELLNLLQYDLENDDEE